MAEATREIAGVELPPAGKYELDVAHTAVEFVARHMLTKVRGRFTDFSGWVEVADRPEDSQVHVEIKTGSIQTNTQQRDDHLKSDDFLNVEKWPVMTFDFANPYCLVHNQGTVTYTTGSIVRSTLLADVPKSTDLPVISMVPYAQLRERGFVCHDGGSSILKRPNCPSASAKKSRARKPRKNGLWRIFPKSEPVSPAKSPMIE